MRPELFHRRQRRGTKMRRGAGILRLLLWNPVAVWIEELNREAKATKGRLHLNKAASAADTRPALMRKSITAQELPTGRSRRGQEADPSSRAFPPPPDGGGEEVCEKSGLKSTPVRLVGSTIFSPPAWEAIARSLQLSARELQIVRGVFDDQKEDTMARALGISIHTIHTHVDRLHHKLAITDRTQ